MPSKADTIDGIPVILKDGIIYSFSQAGSGVPQIKLGTYKDKVATWITSEAQESWLTTFRSSLTPRSRKKSIAGSLNPNEKNEYFFSLRYSMDKSIRMEKHLIEAWGVWWTQWQRQTKDKLKKHVTSPQAFVDQHLEAKVSRDLVSSESKHLSTGSTLGLILPPK
jgi:hypothetical protein